MNGEFSNDNGDAVASHTVAEPDAHGQAAMLLSESILHGLIARSVITIPDAIEIVETAEDVRAEIAADLEDTLPTTHKSLSLLRAIRLSLSLDVKD